MHNQQYRSRLLPRPLYSVAKEEDEEDEENEHPEIILGFFFLVRVRQYFDRGGLSCCYG